MTHGFQMELYRTREYNIVSKKTHVQKIKLAIMLWILNIIEYK